MAELVENLTFRMAYDEVEKMYHAACGKLDEATEDTTGKSLDQFLGAWIERNTLKRALKRLDKLECPVRGEVT